VERGNKAVIWIIMLSPFPYEVGEGSGMGDAFRERA
jgi:hypothetical protein